MSVEKVGKQRRFVFLTTDLHRVLSQTYAKFFY